jgi:hypothetical protein
LISDVHADSYHAGFLISLIELSLTNNNIMKIVRVQYTTTAGYAATNHQNINGIVEELKQLNHPGINYSCCVLADGKTFMHLDHFENEEAHLALQELASFKKFAAALDASGLEVEPELEILSLVAATGNIFE